MGKRFLATLGLISALAIAAATPAGAALTVGNTNDSGAGSLRQAIAEAPPGETIDLPAGTYDLSSGPLSVAKPVTIAGHGSGDTTVRSVANTRVFQVTAEGSLTLSDLSIRDMTRSEVGGVIQGGLITNVENLLSLQRVTISGVTIDVSGGPGGNGGVVQGGLISSAGPMSVSDSSFVRNRVFASGGAEQNGGVIQGGIFLFNGSPVFRNVALDENLLDVRGGQGASNAEQDGGVIQGGVVLLNQDEASSGLLENVSIGANIGDASSGPGASGGVIQGLAVLAGVTNGSLDLKNTTVASNTARALGTTDGIVQAAGLLLGVDMGSTMSLTASTVYANRAESASAANVGNLIASGTVIIGDSIVAGGVGPPGTENCQVVEEEVSSVGFNIESTNQCGFHGNGDKVNTDPLLGPLQSNGGLGLTMVPAANSPAVDQGSRFGLGTDARGVVRPIDLPSIANSSAPGADGSDIGAAELQPSNLLTLGKLKKNKKKGTATLVVNLPQPSAGTLVLTGRGLKKQTKVVSGQASFKLKVATKGGVKKKLRKKGKCKVKIDVTYTPTGNSAATVTRKAKLVKKKKKKKKHKKKRAK